MNKIMIQCIEDKNIDISNNRTRTCGGLFELNEDNIFTMETVDHFSDTVRYYYSICPNCGNLVLVKEEILPYKMKDIAIQKSKEDPLLFRKNSLISQLIYLESLTPKVKTRRRIIY